MSTDAGQNWRHVGLDGYSSVDEIAFSPNFSNDGVILAVGIRTGPINELLRSRDRGKTWNRVGPTFESSHRSFAFSPNYENDHTIFTTFENGELLVSRDQGDDWNRIVTPIDTGVYSLIASPNYEIDKEILIAASNGMWRYTDSGANWQNISKGLFSLESGGVGQILAISSAPLESRLLFVITQGGLFRTPPLKLEQ